MSNIPKNAKFKGIYALYEVMVYNVYSNTDLNEGRGASIKIGSFADQGEANTFSRGRGVYGSPAEVKFEKAEIIVPASDSSGVTFVKSFHWNWDQAQVADNLSPFNPVDLQKKRAEILSKLTAEELEFLGLK